MRFRFYLLLLSAIGILLFFNGFFNGFKLDDYTQIVNFKPIHSLSSVPMFFTHKLIFDSQGQFYNFTYRPIFYSSLAFLFSISPNAFIFHLVQIFIFILNSLLLFFIFSKFFKIKLAFFLSLIFLIHPINQEVGTYISNLQDVLFFFFGILSFAVLIKAKKLDLNIILVSACLCLLSLFSKETGLLFLLLDASYLVLFKKDLFKKYSAIYFLTLIFYLILRFGNNGSFFIKPVNITYSIQNTTFLDRIIISPKIIVYFLQEMIIPVMHLPNIQFLQNTNPLNSILPFVFVFSTAVFFCILGVLIFKNFNKHFNLFSFFSIWFWLGILMHSQLISLDVIIANRWMYFSMVGFLGIAGILVSILEKEIKNMKLRLILNISIFIYVLILFSQTIILNIILH